MAKLALQKNPFPEIPYSLILEQIAAKQKAKNKLPTWFSAKNITYPSKVSVEQTSSEITANYKSSIISGKKLIDLTGGFGVDDYYFAKQFQHVIHCEMNSNLSKIVAHNFKHLQIKNIECFANDSAIILKQLNQKFDCIYIDPSRRSNTKGKVFMLKDCLPNVPENLDFYFSYSNKILVKTAPILDIQAGLSELKFVKEIHIVAVANEVKEVLWLLEKKFDKEIKIKTVNIEKNKTDIFEFKINEIVFTQYSKPLTYLYEPNAALMKSGQFEAIAAKFNVLKLHQHSHLYTSEKLQEFQGRVFKINRCFPFDKKNGKEFLLNKKMNVSCRNFPLKPDEIKKKFKITDGGTVFTFFTTNNGNQKIVLLCEKIQL